MRGLLEQVWVVVGLLLVGAVAGVLVVVALDPDCGPGGDEQRDCAADIADDLGGGR